MGTPKNLPMGSPRVLSPFPARVWHSKGKREGCEGRKWKGVRRGKGEEKERKCEGGKEGGVEGKEWELMEGRGIGNGKV